MRSLPWPEKETWQILRDGRAGSVRAYSCITHPVLPLPPPLLPRPICRFRLILLHSILSPPMHEAPNTGLCDTHLAPPAQ